MLVFNIWRARTLLSYAMTAWCHISNNWRARILLSYVLLVVRFFSHWRTHVLLSYALHNSAHIFKQSEYAHSVKLRIAHLLLDVLNNWSTCSVELCVLR